MSIDKSEKGLLLWLKNLEDPLVFLCSQRKKKQNESTLLMRTRECVRFLLHPHSLYLDTGFAFSQEEGNNSEIINQVLNLSLKKDLTFTGTSHTSKLLSEDLRRKRNTVFSTDRLKIESGNNKNLDVIKEDKIE